MRLSALAHECTNGGGQGSPERIRLDRGNVGIIELGEGVSGKVVIAARLHRGHPLAEAGKRERVVAKGADVMLGLPDTPALDARARVERVDDAPSEEIPRDRRRGNKEVTRDRWLGRLRVARRCLAKQKPESWSGG